MFKDVYRRLKCNLWIIYCNMDMVILMEKFPNARVSDGLSRTVVIPGEFTHITGFKDLFDVSLNNYLSKHYIGFWNQMLNLI